jgi:ornithine cyclodeaminase/alanine dehydrogenase-like protein (mu-crystallin family)
MALLLTEDDLRPLSTDPGLIADGLDVIAESLAGEPGTDPGDCSWLAFPLAEAGARLNVNVLTTPRDATRLMLWPTGRQAAPDRVLALLVDRSEGRVVALLRSSHLLWRTAGAVVLACRHLAPPDARTLAMLGSGVQARQHLVGLRQAVPGLRAIRVFSPTPANRRRYAADAAELTGLHVTAVDSADEAVAGADIVCDTAGSPTPVFESSRVRPGALVTEIGLGAPHDLAARTIVPSAHPVPARPSGWPAHPEAGGMAAPVPATTLAAVIRGEAPARTRPDETVYFPMHGVFGWDAALPWFAYRWARESGVGTELDL